jgi:hypothetical protein
MPIPDQDFIPNQTMLAKDDYPTRTIVHPPRLRGGLGRGFLNIFGCFWRIGIS